MMPKKPVTLFIQCLVDALSPEAALSMVRIFEKLRIPFEIPSGQTCCGQPAFNAGYQRQAAAAAKKFISIFENRDVIVCPSGSCVDMVKHHYPTLFKSGSEWHERAKNIRSKMYEFTQYLVDVLHITDVGAVYHGKITYHDSCHLMRNLGIFEQPRKLISHIRGTTFIEMKDSTKCCGFGGTFAVKYPEISAAILTEKVDNILATGADTLVGCDLGCLMNIKGMLNRKNPDIKVMHIAQLLGGQWRN